MAVDRPYAKIGVSALIGIATVVVALPSGDLLPQFPDLLRLVPVIAMESTVEEERGVKMKAPVFTLLQAPDVACLTVEDRITFSGPNECF